VDRDSGRQVVDCAGKPLRKSPIRAVSTWLNDNTIRYEMFETRGGIEAKSMEITCTRM
jgi:hypothetical protein